MVKKHLFMAVALCCTGAFAAPEISEQEGMAALQKLADKYQAEGVQSSSLGKGVSACQTQDYQETLAALDEILNYYYLFHDAIGSVRPNKIHSFDQADEQFRSLDSFILQVNSDKLWALIATIEPFLSVEKKSGYLKLGEAFKQAKKHFDEHATNDVLLKLENSIGKWGSYYYDVGMPQSNECFAGPFWRQNDANIEVIDDYFYSFWFRRYLAGTSDKASQILDDIISRLENPDKVQIGESNNGQVANSLADNDLAAVGIKVATDGASEPTTKDVVATQPEGQANASQCDGVKVCMEAKTGLPLQVLPRAFSNVYKNPSAQSDNVAEANIEPFIPLYVFAQQDIDLSDPANPTGWYQIGKNTQSASGWMQAKDVMEWKQALVVSYTHPGDEIEGRKPVIMFKDLASIENIVAADDVASETEKLYQQIETSGKAEGVISKEPKRYIDINNKLYILPILDWTDEIVDNEDIKLLKIAAAVPNARGSDTLDNQEYAENANAGREDGFGANLENLKIDIVFVIDTTRSMQPYIDTTRNMLDSIATQIANAGDIKFGVVGFRDDSNATKSLEYTSKNFTPELVDAKELVNLFNTEVEATHSGSQDYAEEVFAGVEEGLRSNWRENAARFIVLIGDASSHALGHEKNTSNKDENALLREIKDSKVNILSVHLKNPKATKDHAIAQQQFGVLATIKGEENEQALFTVDTEDGSAFEKVAKRIIGVITDNYATVNNQSSEPEKIIQTDINSRDIEVVEKVWKSALIEYIGQSATPPKDIVAWVADKDLTNIFDRALEVRVLITKEQLSNLSMALDRLLQALGKSSVSQSDFFTALQSIAGQAMKRPEDISNATKLADTGLLPAFINSLPYKSDILNLTIGKFGSMSTDQRMQLEAQLQAKLKQYLEINSNTDVWHTVNEDDPNSTLVHPLLIDYLP